MLYRTEDLARWGAGKGSNLLPVEIDENNWEIEGRLQVVEAAALEAANGIANVTVTGSQMTVWLEDGTALGPFTLPTAMIRYRGDWTATTAYSELDLVTVDSVGLYLVLEDHTSDAAAFDALAEDAEGNQLYRYLLPIGEPSVSAEGTEVHASPVDLNFAGAGVSVIDDGDDSVTINIAGASAIAAEGVQIVGTPTEVNFAGAGVSVEDDGDGTVTVTIPGIGAVSIDALSDVTISAPATGQFLRYNGSAFVNAAIDWSDLANVPASFTPSAHSHPTSEVDGFAEAVQDAVGAMIVAGANIAVTYDDGAGTLTIASTGGGGGAGGPAPIEEIAGTSYTQVAGDATKWKRTTSASAVTITIDAGVNAAEDEITFEQGGAGQITFVAGSGMTLTSASDSLVSAGDGAVLGLKFISGAQAVLFGHTATEEAGGGGSGDMTAAVYDPSGVEADAFDRANHTGEQAIGTVTDLQANLDARLGRNKLINPSFRLWHRGTSLAAAVAPGYLADRWTNQGAGTTTAPSRQSFILGQTAVPGEPAYLHRSVVASVAGAGNYAYLIQRIEDVRTLAGQTATLTFYGKADAIRNIAVEFAQVFGTGGSPSAAVTAIGAQLVGLSGSWARFEITIAIPSISGKTIGTAGDDYLQLAFWFDAGLTYAARAASLGQQSGTFDIAQVQLEAGGVATPFDARPIAVEQALCDRYYQKLSGAHYGGLYFGNNTMVYVQSRGLMRAVPTVTYNSYLNGTGGSTVSTLIPTASGCGWYYGSGVAPTGSVSVTNAYFDAEL